MTNGTTREALVRRLRDEMAAMPVLDTHEHFTPEPYHLTNRYNFYYWLMPYIQYDLVSVGMDPRHLWRPPADEAEVDARFREIRDLWPLVRNNSYARPFRMALKEFYGEDDLTEANYRELGRRMDETRYPGRYREILQERCGIRGILNQTGAFDYGDPFMRGSVGLVNRIVEPEIRKFLDARPDAGLDDLADDIRAHIDAAKAGGAILAKFDASSFLVPPDRKAAEAEFGEVRKGAPLRIGALSCWLYEQALAKVGEVGLVAAVHTGVWGDINYKKPELLFPVVERHRNVTFDIYHMGMPYTAACGFLGKNYPNAYLNLCWSHIVSERMTVHALDEWMDYVPMSKIFGFGGDFNTMPENIWAHLEIARENFAEVMADRILRGRLDLDEALRILRAWFFDNPVRVYGWKGVEPA